MNHFLVGLTIIFCFQFTLLFSQSEYEQKDYYMFPLKPDQQNFFAGTMGELRSNHFHGGLDVKTGGAQGLFIYAAAEGYISRLKVSAGGYGNVLYMTHPNGQTTVYAHLQRFIDPIAKYVLQQQYEKESYEIELYPPKEMFQFKKGEIIAYSGNSGSSTAPHLHFEIRDVQQRPMNLVQFGFSELVDRLSPSVLKLAFKPLSIHSRLEGQFARLEKGIYKKDGVYHTYGEVNAIGDIGLEVQAHDRANGTTNKYGINHVEIESNGTLIYEHTIDQIPFADNRYINAFIDYKHWKKTRKKFQRCYQTDANRLKIYKSKSLDGILKVEEGKTYDVVMRLYDSFGNKSEVHLKVIGKKAAATGENRRGDISMEVVDNVLYFTTPKKDEHQPATIYARFFTYQLIPAYTLGNYYVYLWDLRKAIPDSITVNGNSFTPNIRQAIPAGAKFSFYNEIAGIEAAANALFDTLYLQLEQYGNEIQINDEYTTFFRRILVKFKPTGTFEKKDKMAVYSRNKRGGLRYEGGSWTDDGRMSFSPRSGGNYVVDIDTLAPTIRLISKSSRRIKFVIKDLKSGIKTYRATLNGKWLLMEYDKKQSIITSKRLDKTQPLKGNFVLTVEDNVGNVKTYRTSI